MKDYEWITFDCYGTLIGWENGISSAFERIARASAAQFDRNKVLALYRKFEAQEELVYRKYRDVLSRVAIRICQQMGYQVKSGEFLPESLPRWRPFADTNEALQALRGKYKLGILSNVDNNLLDQTRRHFSVQFDMVITAENVGSYKPAPAHFNEARRKIGNVRWLHAAQSYFHDIVPCGRLQIDSAWINRTQEKATQLPPTNVFEGQDLAAFANWLQQA